MHVLGADLAILYHDVSNSSEMYLHAANVVGLYLVDAGVLAK